MKLFALFVTTLFVLAACTGPIDPSTGLGTGTPVSGSDGALKEFTSKQQLIDYLQENKATNNNYYGRGNFAVLEMGAVAMDSAVSAPMVKSSASDYSTTNVQVKGVDEADIVKNDDKYIYILAGETLAIIDAYPAEDGELLSETHIRGRPQNLFLDGDRVIVFTTDYEEKVFWPEYSLMPVPRNTQVTKALVFDVSDKEDPEVIETIEIAGNYFQSRMIGNDIYVIANDDLYWRDTIIDTPTIRANDEILSPRLYYFDNPEDNYRFTTVTSFNTDGEDVRAESYLMGYANTMYMSEDNLYVAYRKNLPWRQEQRERFFDIVLPEFPSDIREEITAIQRTRMSEEAQWERISGIIEEHMNKLDEDERDELLEDIEDAVEKYEAEQAEERAKTVIHKIAIDNGRLDYAARGEVPGYLLNQFSLDEYEGNLRVATNLNVWTRNDRVQHNNVYVLDEDLDIIGEVEGIAKDERIYSTRFMGDRLYMVTFRQVDPFFVIDLSNPRDPEILGELKIPGWSSYLHPYDEDHIIGIGKQTKENEWGGVQTLGVKMSLFDVSDPENPKEIDTYEIGTSGSDSEVLNDHKAFLFDKERELLVLPIREVKDSKEWDARYDYWRNRVWQGAYVFTVTDEGFERRARITHHDGDDSNWNWWGSPHSVRRALYMDDVLYTISLGRVLMHDLDDFDELNDIEVPYENPNNYDRPMPMAEVGDAVMVDEEPVVIKPHVIVG